MLLNTPQLENTLVPNCADLESAMDILIHISRKTRVNI